ncbi:MAG: ferrochelatase, partial [Geitlerinemataceae cyanobacterium]
IDRFYRVPALDTDPTFIDDLANLALEALEAPSMKFDTVARPQKKVKMYPQERWAWGMTPAAEVWNGRVAMVGFLLLLAEMISGSGPLHYIGLL